MKRIFATFFISSLALNIYLLNTEVAYEETTFDNLDENYRAIPRPVIEQDQVELAQAAIKKDCNCPSISQNKMNSDQDKVEQENASMSDELEFDEEVYQRESKEFYESANKKIAEYLEYNAGLNVEQVDLYYQLRDDRQKEIDAFVKGRFDEMESNGAKHLFLSLEDTVEMGKINQKYLEKFKNSVGDRAYEMYQGFKERLNTRSQDNNKFAFFIDF